MESALLGLVAQKIGSMITEETSLFLNFKKDFEWLNKKLIDIQGYLRDADAQSSPRRSVKSWLLNVENIALDAEDILDECAVQSRGTDNEISQSSCVCAFSYCELAFRYKMARRIKDVKSPFRLPL
ncbi:hypothetical protein SUGI_0366920 [Cryptomeria japonica]|nr:hypothetical protein SUGI_0366920 [Cryptomeria japonica]